MAKQLVIGAVGLLLSLRRWNSRATSGKDDEELFEGILGRKTLRALSLAPEILP